MGMRYWQRYDRKYKMWNIKKIYYFIRSKSKKLGNPFNRKSNRGRPYSLSPYEYASSFILFTIFDFSLRDDEFISDLLFGKHIDHSTFGKAFAKISYIYIKKLLILIRNEINNLIQEKPILIADSTGVIVDRMYFQTLNKCKIRKRRFYDKLSVLVEYYPANRTITISDADSLFSSDSLSAKIMLSEIETNADKFFADAGYDSNELFEKLLMNKIVPIVRIKKRSGKLKKFRKVVREMFDDEEYKKYRSVIEGVFGGLENRRLLFTRYRKKSMRMKHIIAMAIVHNISTYMTISLFILIKSTNPFKSQCLNTESMISNNNK